MTRRPRASKGPRAQPTPKAAPPAISTYATPCSSAIPSTHPSDDERERNISSLKSNFIRRLTLKDFNPQEPQRVELPVVPITKPFRFLDLPSELRIKVYEYHFQGVVTEADPAIDLNPDNGKRMQKKIALLRTCRTVYTEASHFFYSSHTFRLFPTHASRFFKSRRPLLARLKPHQRACITKVELRLGPGWGKPPPGWVVTQKLGLKDCINVRRLNVLVQIDPSATWLEGFRKADGFYEAFSRNLMQSTLAAMPWLDHVELDAWPGVKRDCPIMTDLAQVAVEQQRGLSWARSLVEREEKEASDEAAKLLLAAARAAANEFSAIQVSA